MLDLHPAGVGPAGVVVHVVGRQQEAHYVVGLLVDVPTAVGWGLEVWQTVMRSAVVACDLTLWAVGASEEVAVVAWVGVLGEPQGGLGHLVLVVQPILRSPTQYV